MVETIAAVILTLAPHVPPQNAMGYAESIHTASATHRVDWRALTATIHRESRFKRHARSKTNDYGLGQHHCPSFFCDKVPTPAQMACLMDPGCNIHLTARELSGKIRLCRKKRTCKDFLQLYNPGSHGYAQRTRDVMDRIDKIAASVNRPKLSANP